MRFFLPVKNCCERALSRKKTLIIFAVLFLTGIILGIIFIKTPAMYDYHLARCDRFIDRVLFSDRSVFVIFLERTFGHILILLPLLLAGIHPAALVVTPFVLVFRAYTFGGSIAIFFSVYRLSGTLLVLALYIPIHLLIDAVFFMAIAVSFARAKCFRFCKSDFLELFCDLLVFACMIALICFAEMLLLLILFHPIGNIL